MTSDTAQAVVVPDRRQHPAYLVIAAGQTIRALIPLIAVSIWQAPWWALGIVGGLVVVIAVVAWLTSRYGVAEAELRVRTGVLARKTVTIPIRRITAVEAKRGLVQRALGVWGLKVQTPGDGDKSSVTLHSLRHDRLEELLSALRPQVAGVDAAAAPTSAWQMPGQDGEVATSGQVVARLGTRTLLVAAVTGTSVPIILAGGGAVWNRLHDVLPESYQRWVEDTIVGQGAAFVIAALAVLLVIAVLVGIAVTSLRLAKFTLIRDGERLRVNRGLVSQRSGTIQVDRIQAVRLVEGLWRRLLGYCALEVEVAGVSQRDDNERMLFPLVRRDRAHALITRALPELGWQDRALRPLDQAVRRRYLTLPLVYAVVPTVGAAFLPGWWALLAVPWLPLALVVGWKQGADAAWSIDQNNAVVRFRLLLARHTVIARVHRVQITRTTQTPFQRRAGLAGVTLSLSSTRSARLRHLDASDASLLLHTVGRRTGRRLPRAADSGLALPTR